MIYIGNAFSLNMLPADLLPATISVQEVMLEEVASAAPEATSAIGHQSLINILRSKFGLNIEANRISVSLSGEDVLYVVQYIGPRLPEGATTLPEGAQIKFLKVTFK
jgi:hypothetical protein